MHYGMMAMTALGGIAGGWCEGRLREHKNESHALRVVSGYALGMHPSSVLAITNPS